MISLRLFDEASANLSEIRQITDDFSLNPLDKALAHLDKAEELSGELVESSNRIIQGAEDLRQACVTAGLIPDEQATDPNH